MRIRTLSRFCLLWIASFANAATIPQISFREYPLSNPPTYTVTGITSDDVGEFLWGTDQNFKQIVSIHVETGEVTRYSAQPASGEDIFLIGSSQAAVFSEGNVWFPAVVGFGTTAARSVMGRFSTTTTSLDYFNTLDPHIFGGGPTFVARGGDGNVWYASSFSGKAGKITKAGVATEFNVATASGVTPQSIRGIGYGGNHHIYLTSGFRSVFEFDPAGGSTIEHRIQGGSYRAPAGVVQGPDSAMYIALMGSTADSGNKILRLSYTGLQTEWAIPTADSGVTALAFGSNGKLYGTEQFAKQILEFNISTGEMSESPVANGEVPLGITAVASSTGKTRIAFNAFPANLRDGAAQLAEIGGGPSEGPDLTIDFDLNDPDKEVEQSLLIQEVRAGSEATVYLIVKNQSTIATPEGSVIGINFSLPPTAQIRSGAFAGAGGGSCDPVGTNSEGGPRLHCETSRQLLGGDKLVITTGVTVFPLSGDVSVGSVPALAEVKGGGDASSANNTDSSSIFYWVLPGDRLQPVAPNPIATYDPPLP